MHKHTYGWGIENTGQLIEKGSFGGYLNINLLLVLNNIKLFEQC